MKKSFPYSDQAARYVEGIAENSKLDLPLTMTITREKSGGYSVQIVTDDWLEDTASEQVVRFYSETQVNT